MNFTHVSLDRKENAILGLISEMVDPALNQALPALVESAARATNISERTVFLISVDRIGLND